MTLTAIKNALASVWPTYLNPALAAQAVCTLEEGADTVVVNIVLGMPTQPIREAISVALKSRLDFGNKKIKINIQQAIASHAVQQGLRGLPQVKNIIAVASGKGGVGKSTTAVNLALALQAAGAEVGLLDADIYGPNQPQMLGVKIEPESVSENKVKPIRAHGIQSMSIGYLLVSQDTPMIWRGPMVSTALQQLLHNTLWEGLDYLIIDLPPGTGDIQLTLAQKIPVSGALIVTTPQDIALLDVRKAIRMFEKVRVPVLGVIENMSLHVCSQCGHEEAIFGQGGAAKLREQYGVPFLGQLPLDRRIREDVDQGRPTVVNSPDHAIAKAYMTIALKLAAQLALTLTIAKNPFPKIVIE